MAIYLILLTAIVAILLLGVWFTWRFSRPEMTAKTLLQQYHEFERLGLSESERLLKLFATRGGWRALPGQFLRELTVRLGSKDDVISFIILTERYGFDRERIPRLIAGGDLQSSMASIARSLGSLGNRLQAQGRLDEAESVLRLALRLEPDESAIILPLALNCYYMGRYLDAIPMFQRGLPLFEQFTQRWGSVLEGLSLPEESFGSSEDYSDMSSFYRNIYEECLTHAGLEPIDENEFQQLIAEDAANVAKYEAIENPTYAQAIEESKRRAELLRREANTQDQLD